jgi:hypothetical protein
MTKDEKITHIYAHAIKTPLNPNGRFKYPGNAMIVSEALYYHLIKQGYNPDEVCTIGSDIMDDLNDTEVK